ncbi:penicillin-binding protein activator [Salinispirillum marinum]|uniref:Penicillin-binding protein activator n=2 Tax=Saccharospirillaceae TaxID=255527 RepID=A0ABV8BC29_9GAMM
MTNSIGFPHWRRGLALFCLVLLGACSTTPSTDSATTGTAPSAPTEEASVPDLPLDTERPIDELAQELPSDYEQSTLFELNLTPDSEYAYSLELAKIFYLRREPEQATRLLSTIPFNELDPSAQRDYAVVAAKSELALFNSRAALGWLTGEQAALFDGLPIPQQIELGLLRAQAYSLGNQPVAAARERIYLHPLLDPEQRSANIEAIWLEMQFAEPAAIERLGLLNTSPDYTGWVELAGLYHQHQDDLETLMRQIARWQAQNPQHPAARQLPVSLLSLSQSVATRPDHIAVILPQSGPLSPAGEAIMDGFMAAYFSAKNEGRSVPELSFYDEASVNDVTELISQAIEDGADLIVGPLNRPAVETVEQYNFSPIPILALNRTDNRTQPNPQVIQFALAPEDEAQQAAQQAFQQGHRVAAIIVPEGDWGRRVAESFRREWRALGGEMVARQDVRPRDDGFRYLAQVKELLNIDESEQRAREINAMIPGNLQAEPRRRRDIDLIFMAVQPDQARQLRPLLNYQYAEDLPVMSISSIVATGNGQRNSDLDGVRFLEIPWQLSEHPLQDDLRALSPAQYERYARLYAMGLDAFNLVPRMRFLQQDPAASYQGVTGTITLAPNGQLNRRLRWAEFVNGRIMPLDLGIEDPIGQANESSEPAS